MGGLNNPITYLHEAKPCKLSFNRLIHTDVVTDGRTAENDIHGRTVPC